MVAMEDARILNKDSTKTFLFRAVNNWRTKKSQGVISIPLIDTTPSNTVLFRFMGQTEETSFGFALFNDGTDVSNGSEYGGIRTIDDQISFLRDTIYSDEYDTDWTLTQIRHYPSGVDGVVTNLDIEHKAGSVTLLLGSITFIRGKIGAL